MSASLALPQLLPYSALKLGNVVVDREDPMRSIYASPGLVVSEEEGNIDLGQHDRGAGLSVILSRILKASFAASRHRDHSIEAASVKTYIMKNAEDTVFPKLCDEDVQFQLWLEKTTRNKDAYFVVGLQTLVDADVGIGSARGISGTAGTSVSTGHPAADVEVEGTISTQAERDVSFTADGEQIFAVKYRKIRLNAFGTKDIDQAHLSSRARWQSRLNTRAKNPGPVPELQASLAAEEANENLDIVWDDGKMHILASSRTINPAMKS
ncbi:hypothetical protein LTR27_010935 [Elasticomyces elasticus]|nr:hypothetical protein LTR27_010935 [Elasticomyces elasticus]